tara:strand:- start:233 stop:847 length:615 start_codon:yes stop_codon:yes gene_type:complete
MSDILYPFIPNLPNNVHKTIAEYLQPIELEAMIVIYKYTGCKMKEHHYKTPCEKCDNVYNPSKIFIYSKKNSNPILTKYYINKLKTKLYSNCNLKYPCTKWLPHIFYKMNDLFVQGETNPNIQQDILSKDEKKEYDTKYIIYGVITSLFNNFVKELDIDNFKIKNIGDEKTVYSISRYYEIEGKKSFKNPLCVLNKLYYKYTNY